MLVGEGLDTKINEEEYRVGTCGYIDPMVAECGMQLSLFFCFHQICASKLALCSLSNDVEANISLRGVP